VLIRDGGEMNHRVRVGENTPAPLLIGHIQVEHPAAGKIGRDDLPPLSQAFGECLPDAARCPGNDHTPTLAHAMTLTPA
jgi:hypothetical protein